MAKKVKMIERKTWKEFRESGLLWCANRILHMFGWAIVYSTDDDGKTTVYPARVRFRGFDADTESKNFIKLSGFMAKNAQQLLNEAKD